MHSSFCKKYNHKVNNTKDTDKYKYWIQIYIFRQNKVFNSCYFSTFYSCFSCCLILTWISNDLFRLVSFPWLKLLPQNYLRFCFSDWVRLKLYLERTFNWSKESLFCCMTALILVLKSTDVEVTYLHRNVDSAELLKQHTLRALLQSLWLVCSRCMILSNS